MTKKVLIVGGGIVGITAAYFEAIRGHKVTLIEAADEVGGLLKSSQTDFGCFDYGTHIPSATGVKILDDFLFADEQHLLHSFDVQKSGSFLNNELTEFSPFLNLNSLGKELGKIASSELINAPKTDAFDDDDGLKSLLLARYGSSAYQHAFLPFITQTFGVAPDQLPAYYLNFFDMYRVVAYDEKTTIKLKEIDYINDRLGFQQHTPGTKKYYPKEGGVGAWTQQLLTKVIDAGVEVITGSAVTAIDYLADTVAVTYHEKVQHFDTLVWTVSSALLTRLLPLETQLQRPNFRTTAIFDFVFESPLLTDCKYINNFSAKHISTRLTCYQNLIPASSFYATTVEVLTDKIDDQQLMLAQVVQELNEMGLVSADNRCVFSQYRPIKEGFPVITAENDQRLKLLNQEIEDKYPKLVLLGRSSSKGFFMSELLIAAYQACH